MTRDRSTDRNRARSGVSYGPRVILNASAEQIALWDRAVERAGAFSRADWARHVLDLAACDELGLDPITWEPLD